MEQNSIAPQDTEAEKVADQATAASSSKHANPQVESNQLKEANNLNAQPKESTRPELKDGKRFTGINHDLKSALDTWSELSEKLTGKVSPEQEQLKEIKKLLGDLKNKLQDFS